MLGCSRQSGFGGPTTLLVQRLVYYHNLGWHCLQIDRQLQCRVKKVSATMILSSAESGCGCHIVVGLAGFCQFPCSYFAGLHSTDIWPCTTKPVLIPSMYETYIQQIHICTPSNTKQPSNPHSIACPTSLLYLLNFGLLCSNFQTLVKKVSPLSQES